jgi:hypothetical protein
MKTKLMEKYNINIQVSMKYVGTQLFFGYSQVIFINRTTVLQWSYIYVTKSIATSFSYILTIL